MAEDEFQAKLDSLEAERYPPEERQVCVDAIKDLVKERIAQRTPFEDTGFPHDKTALWRDPNAPADPSLISHPTGWKRLSEMCPGTPLFVEGQPVNPEDVEQGCIGTCFLLGALSVFATKKGVVENLFIAHDVAVGIYGLCLFQNGFFRAIIIDDFVPYAIGKNPPWSGKPCPLYACNKVPSALWCSLIEKAYAKLYYVYEHIDGGTSRYAMEDLTGGISYRISMSYPQRRAPRDAVPPLDKETAMVQTNDFGEWETHFTDREMWGPTRFGLWRLALVRDWQNPFMTLPEFPVECEFSLKMEHGIISGGGTMTYTDNDPLDVVSVSCKGKYTMAGVVHLRTERVGGADRTSHSSMFLKGQYYKAMANLGGFVCVRDSRISDLVVGFDSMNTDGKKRGVRLMNLHLQEKFPVVVSAFDSLFDELHLKFRAGAILSCAVEVNDPDVIEELDASTGLLYNHAYGIIDIKKVDGFSLIKVRNPHATGEWTGRFCDSDGAWPKDLKQKLNVSDVDDGEFWMDYRDFINTWSYVDVCRMTDEWHSHTFQDEFDATLCGGSMNWTANPQYRLTWNTPGVTTFLIRASQPNTKIYSGEDEYPVVLGIVVSVADSTSGRQQPEGAIVITRQAPTSPDRSTLSEVQLAPSKHGYIITLFTSVPNIDVPYTLNVYGTAPFDLEVATDGEEDGSSGSEGVGSGEEEEPSSGYDDDVDVPGDDFASWYYNELPDILDILDGVIGSDDSSSSSENDVGGAVVSSLKSALTSKTNMPTAVRVPAKANVKERGRSTKARGRTTKARGRTTKARGRTTKARGRATKARGRTVKARGRNTKARGRTTKARGRTVKARGRNVKARGRAPKARGKGHRELQNIQGYVVSTKSATPVPSFTVTGAIFPHSPDFEYSVPEGKLRTEFGGASPGGRPFSTGLFDCHHQPKRSLCLCLCLPCAAVQQSRILEERDSYDVWDCFSALCATMGLPCQICFCALPIWLVVGQRNRNYLHAVHGIAEGDRCDLSGQANDVVAVVLCTCCALCQQDREIQRIKEEETDRAPLMLSMRV